MSSTANQTESSSFAPIPLPSTASRPSTSSYHSEPPYPSPSIENISGFPRINTGGVDESTDDSEFDTAAYPYPNSKTKSESKSVSSPSAESRTKTPTESDPFAEHREGSGTENNPFTFGARDETEYGDENRNEDEDQGLRPERACDKTERRSSDNTDTPKSPSASSRVQSPRGSVLVPPRSRDGHVEKDHEKHGRHPSSFEKGWAKITGRRSSREEKD